ncbi:MAG: tRNA-dihydrouridine synthase family protein, partial [Eubacterium sp.]|nr:tRNA-dihydrouridine synthase family protein [Eubacterium sp.]
MKYYAAPLEGITGYIYRNAHHKYYPGVDKYFTPFLSPKIKRGMNTKEQKDIAPANNRGIPLVPQILTNQPDGFLQLARILGELGYEEINFNLGCPSATVVNKGRGCGFLRDRDALRRFFDEVMSGLEQKGMGSLKISVKTRLGVNDPEEILPLMEIYNDYPFSEIIIHARLLRDYYKGPVRRDAFREAAAISRHPLCYNGDLFTPKNLEEFRKECPDMSRVMMGRGLIADPQLCEMCRTSLEGQTPVRDYDRMFRFLREISDNYAE